MTEMIFDTCQRLEGHVWCSIVQDLIVERWQTFLSEHQKYVISLLLIFVTLNYISQKSQQFTSDLLKL
jgi:hypothetical protein